VNLLRRTEETIEPGKKRRHRRNKVGVCLDCGDVSYRAVQIKKPAADWTCPHCRSEIEWDQADRRSVQARTPARRQLRLRRMPGSVGGTADNRLRRMTEAEFRSRRPASQKIICDARAGRYSR